MLMASCASTPLVIKPTLPDPSPVLSQACDAPIRLPETDLNTGDVESYWLMDRAALLACGERLDVLSDWYQQRDRALSQ